jgi:hypothetical protein
MLELVHFKLLAFWFVHACFLDYGMKGWNLKSVLINPAAIWIAYRLESQGGV